jgi:hypothetical protein
MLCPAGNSLLLIHTHVSLKWSFTDYFLVADDVPLPFLELPLAACNVWFLYTADGPQKLMTESSELGDAPPPSG